MKLIREYIFNFINRSGAYVFFATLFARLASFFSSWIVLQLVPNKRLGVVLFALSVVQFLMPITGLGLYQSLMRYGALLDSPKQKNDLFIYVFKKGMIACVFMVCCLILIGAFFPFEFDKTGIYLIFLSFILIPTFLVEIIKIQFRLFHENKYFSYIEIVHNLIQTFLVASLTYIFAEKGYIASLIIAPVFTFMLFYRKLNISFSSYTRVNIKKIQLWKYGFFAGLTSVSISLLFIIDIFLVGYLSKDSAMVTAYRYVSIIPYSLLFFSRVFIATDFIAFTEKIYDKAYIFRYIKSHMALLSLLSVFFFVFSWLFSKQILSFLDPNFVVYSSTFLILIFGVCGILIFRGIFSNLLSSLGKFEKNYYITSVAIILNIISNYYLIPKYGIKGAAITSAFLMWGTGICSSIWFWRLYKKV